MKKTTNTKTKLTASIAIVLLLISAFMLAVTPISAQTLDEGGVSGPLQSGIVPDLELSTIAFMSFTPNPIGVNSPLLVNLWLEPPLHRARYHKNYKVTFTDPEGNEDVVTIDSYHADTTAWFTYYPDKVGTWTLKFDFLGTYYPAGDYREFRAGRVSIVNFPESVYYQPSSSPELELDVTEEQVLSWPPSPLPTDYWTRPISPENREWWPIA
jgi:hypothetical protein